MWHIVQNILLSIFILVSSLILFIFIYYQYAFKHWAKLGVPHPQKPNFPFGNFNSNFSQIGQVIAQIYTDMKSKGHAFCGYYLFAMPVFMPIDPEINRLLLTTNFNSFVDRGFHSDEKNDPMGSSLLTWSGEKWKKMRTKLSPTLSAGKMKMMLPNILKCTEDLENVIGESVDKGEPLDIHNIAKRYAVDVICSCAFGVESNCLQNPNAEFIRHANMIVSTSIIDNLRMASGITAPFINRAFNIDLFNPTATAFFRKVVHDTVAHREANNIERDDFLNLMIRLKNNKSIKDGEENNNETLNDESGMTLDQVAAQCFVFFLGGYETTSTTTQFMLYELAKNDDIQQKVRQEVREVLKKFDHTFTYEAIREMRYLENVFYETLRKYPIVLMLNRLCTEDFKIRDTDIVIKKGTQAVLSTLAIHKDPEFYPDPEKFDPNRFTDEAKAKRHPFTYLPFGDEPRICPGIRFGLMEVKLCVAFLLLKFKFGVHPSSEEIKLCSIGNFLATETPIILTAERV